MECFLVALPIVFGFEAVSAKGTLIGPRGILRGRFHSGEALFPSSSRWPVPVRLGHLAGVF